MGTDNNYSYGAMVLITSLYEHKPDASLVHIHLGYIPEDLSSKRREMLQLLCDDLGLKVTFHEVEAKHDIQKRHISRTTLLKFYFIENLEYQFFWLDTDTVAAPGWGHLFEYLSTRGNSEFVVVANTNGTAYEFNAGVIGRKTDAPITLQNWEKMLSSEGSSLDQEIFRQLLEGRVTHAPNFYNKTEWWGRQLEKTVSSYGRIFHFVGPIKPWHLSVEMRSICVDAKCHWSWWFRSEDYLWGFWQKGSVRRFLEEEQKNNQRGLRQGPSRLTIWLLNSNSGLASKIVRGVLITTPFEFLMRKMLGLDTKNMHPVH